MTSDATDPDFVPDLVPAGQNDPTLQPTERPGPSDFADRITLVELRRAVSWCGVIALFLAFWYLSQPLLVLFGGIVVSAMLDGGARLLGRVLPIPRAWRLTIVIVAVALFFVWVLALAGTQLAAQFSALRTVLTAQLISLQGWATAHGLMNSTDLHALGSQILGSLNRVTTALGTLAAGLTDGVMIVVLGAYLAIDPHTYQRGLAWLIPMDKRKAFYATIADMGFTLRRLMAGRLLGMTIEGVATGVLLGLYGIPMAALLGVITGVMAFLPNIGALISGSVIILVGFSTSWEAGLYAIGVYLIVQTIDGYIIVPYVAKKSVDLPPALVLAAQILLGTAFGLLGLMFADSLLAMVKVALIHKANGRTARPAPHHWLSNERAKVQRATAAILAGTEARMPGHRHKHGGTGEGGTGGGSDKP